MGKKRGLILDPDHCLANLFQQGPESQYLCFVGHRTSEVTAQLSPCNANIAVGNA